MKFKIDENLPVELADLLRQAGHDAATIYDQEMAGEPDPQIVAICRAEERAVVSFDLDFADLRTYPPEEHFGLVVLRLKRQDKLHVQRVFARLVPLLENEPLAGKLWIVDENRVRIRG